MRQFYDLALLITLIVVICLFMMCSRHRSGRMHANAKFFGMASSPRGSELEYEDVHSSDMDTDTNDDLQMIEQRQEREWRLERKRYRREHREEANNKDDVSIIIDDTDREELKTDGDVLSDSTDDELSMARMREEYYRSQTLSKRIRDILEDIRDVLKSKHTQIQRKFVPKKPMIVVPMAADEEQASPDNSKQIDVAVASPAESECEEKVREEYESI